jgi:hypothetical protein
VPAFIAKSNGNSFNLAGGGATLVAGLAFDGERVIKEDYLSILQSAIAPGAFS